jgi:hypothetical protein
MAKVIEDKSENNNAQRHARKMWDLSEKLKPQVDAIIDSYKDDSKSAAKSAKDVISRYVNNSSQDELVALALLMHSVKNSAHSYRCAYANLNREWGKEKFLLPYIIHGNRYELISQDSRVYRKVSKIVYGVKKQQKGKDRLIGLSGIVKANGGDHYVAMITGGNNGNSNWSAYLESIKKIVDSFKHAWVVEISQHSDVYYVLIGFDVESSK